MNKNEIIINEIFHYDNYDFLLPSLYSALDFLKVKNVSFSVIFVGQKYIKELNKTYRDKDTVTDVISFAFKDYEDVETNLLGDIYICIPVMKKQAKEYEHSEKRELTFLALHGLLHLLGYDHMMPEDEKVMFGLQDKILKHLDINR